MTKFCIAERCGVVAAVPKEIWDARREQAGDDTQSFPQLKPIFTFTDLTKHPEKEQFVTADLSLLGQLVDRHDMEIQPIYVPFTRGREFGSLGEELRKHELSFITTADEFLMFLGYSSN